MAKQLDSFEFTNRKKGIYPWDKWLNGKPWEMVKGIDYKCGDQGFMAAAATAARNRDLKIRTQRVDGGVVIQAFREG